MLSGAHCKIAKHKAACSKMKFYLAELTFNFPTSQSCMSPFLEMVLCIECTYWERMLKWRAKEANIIYKLRKH